jgi:hypothetical protein
MFIYSASIRRWTQSSSREAAVELKGPDITFEFKMSPALADRIEALVLEEYNAVARQRIEQAVAAPVLTYRQEQDAKALAAPVVEDAEFEPVPATTNSDLPF